MPPMNPAMLRASNAFMQRQAAGGRLAAPQQRQQQVAQQVASRQQQVAEMRAALAQRSVGGQGPRGRGVQVGPVGAQRAGSSNSKADNAAYEQLKREIGVSAPAKGGGGGGGGVKGFLGKAISTGLKPLQLLQIPKNIVQTGVLELEEALLNESDKTPHWMRFMTAKPQQLKWFTPPDEVRAGRSNLDLITGKSGSYKGEAKGPLGFGSMVKDLNTGNKFIDTWGDRGIGFIGDVGLDPLTHVSAGVDKIPGATGRARLALEATDRGLAPEVVEAARTGGGRAVRKLGNEEAIRALELPEPGLRFGGREGWRIPGTGKLDEVMAAGRNRLTEPLRDTKAAELVRRFGVSRDPKLRAAFESLARRQGGEYTPVGAAKFILGKEAAATEGRLTTSMAENLAQDIAHKAGDDPSITHAYEAGDFSHEAAQGMDELARGTLQRQRDVGASVGEHAGKPYIKHMLTPEGEAAFGHEASDIPGFARTGPRPEGTQFSRQIVPGEKYKIMGETFEPVTGTIKEANDWAASKGLPKLYEDSPGRLAANMVLDAQNTSEEAAFWQQLTQEGPHRQAFGLNDSRASSLDMGATRIASKETAPEWLDQLQPHLENIARAADTGATFNEARQGLGAYQRGAQQALGEARGNVAMDVAERQNRLFEQLGEQLPLEAQQQELTQGISKAAADQQVAERQLGKVQAANRAATEGAETTLPDYVQNEVNRLQQLYDQFDQVRQTAKTPNAQRQAVGQMVAAKRGMEDLAKRYAVPVGEAAAQTDTAPFEQMIQRIAGHGQQLEQQLGGVQDTLGTIAGKKPIDMLAEVEAATAARGGALAQGEAPFRQFLLGATVDDLEAQAAKGISMRQLEAQIQHLPEHAQEMIRSTIRDDFDAPKMDKLVDAITQGYLDDAIVREANEGFTRMATDRVIGRDVYVTDEMQSMIKNFNKVMSESRQNPGLLGKIIDAQVQFFKSWALATPGQHVRNAMSATFMNMTEGTTLAEMRDGLQIFAAWRRAGLSERVSGEWVAKLDAPLQTMAPDVIRAVYASGAGGRYTAAEIGARAFGEDAEGGMLGRLFRKTYDNKVTEFSHNIGERWVEGPARAGLAVHALGPEGSGSLTDAIGRIKRVHFDYSDVNELDAKLRRVIPFWTFMSRNLPLQVQQMWTNPRAYSWYQSLMTNVAGNQPNPEGTPEWLSDMNATTVKPGLMFNPDIGPSQVTDTFQSLTHPTRLLSDLNPAWKSIYELAANRNTFYDQPYRDNDYVEPGVLAKPLLPLLRAMGKVHDTPQGPVIERKYLDQYMSNLPLVGTSNRLGSYSSDRSGKGANAAMGFVGVPLRQVDTAKELQNQGYDAKTKARNEQNRRRALAKYGGETG